MKRLSSLMVFFIPLILFSQSDTSSKGIKWTKGLTWDQVKHKARQEGKYIFVDCYTTWCGPCKMMDRDVFSNPRVAAEMNDKFVSVKIQMDTTTEDGHETKKWYADAHNIQKTYSVRAFPTFLFFSPDNVFIHSELGYQKVQDFIRITQLARDPQKPLYYSRYRDFVEGKKYNYEEMGRLAVFTQTLIGDRDVAYQIAKEYKSKYLDKLPKDTLVLKLDIQFLNHFWKLLTPKDEIFRCAYFSPKILDSLFYKGISNDIINRVITNKEIEEKTKAKNSFLRLPNWEKIKSDITKKYKRIDISELLLDYKISYYRSKYIDWNLWAKYKTEKIMKNRPSSPEDLRFYAAGELNTFGAWDAFLNCPDTNVLRKVIGWIDLAIKFFPDSEAYLDTKANLLYKLGNTKEALDLQEKALKINIENAKINKVKPDQNFLNTLEKMKKGIPTWPQSTKVSKEKQ